MSEDRRDLLWNQIYESYYDVYYEEQLVAALLARWKWPNAVTRVLVALTASGSAVAGWALWEQEGFKWAWVSLAGSAAILSIVHNALAVHDSITNHESSHKDLGRVRFEFEKLRIRMIINPSSFDANEIERAYLALLDQYGNVGSNAESDLLYNRSFGIKVQAVLDQQLSDIVERENANGEEEG